MVKRIDSAERGQVVFGIGDGFCAVVEPYADANGGRIVAGGQYVSESDRREMETKLCYTVDL